jgi:hypothetical protein
MTPTERLLSEKRRYSELCATSPDGVAAQQRIRYWQSIVNAEQRARRRTHRRAGAHARRREPVQ